MDIHSERERKAKNRLRGENDEGWKGGREGGKERSVEKSLP